VYYGVYSSLCARGISIHSGSLRVLSLPLSRSLSLVPSVLQVAVSCFALYAHKRDQSSADATYAYLFTVLRETNPSDVRSTSNTPMTPPHHNSNPFYPPLCKESNGYGLSNLLEDARDDGVQESVLQDVQER
jgi:hypothetical protein